jgi:hypothetical protein
LVVKLWERAAGRCEARLPGCQGQATDPCHRKHRKAGGRPAGDDARLSNAWAGCRSCHDWTHARPAEANDLGLLLEEWQDPAVEPMAYQNAGLVVLDDDGGMWPFGEEAS